ncbi:MAG: DNA-processing protein DprA, partial [Alphaproteobacteria bacterium]|nr:DNA-processing protein DprA [Alphaproteobacteria bacterium]
MEAPRQYRPAARGHRAANRSKDVNPEQIAKLRLIRSANIGPVTYRQLLARFGTAERALAALPDLARRGGGRAPVIADTRVIEAEIAATSRAGAAYLFLDDPAYPALLTQTESTPPALIYKGDPVLAARPVVAMVGARNASAAAARFARGLAQELSREGIIIASGLARGIDTASHIGALDGGTIAVIACGIDVVFPPENAGLQADIATRGLLITEHPCGKEPLARHFPARNRIIAGLAVGTVVVEAAPKSGSLITARLANEAGREVMAVPGSPLDPRAQGCNLLIREGATLVQSAADVIEAVQPFGLRLNAPRTEYIAPPETPTDADDAARASISALLGPVPV